MIAAAIATIAAAPVVHEMQCRPCIKCRRAYPEVMVKKRAYLWICN